MQELLAAEDPPATRADARSRRAAVPVWRRHRAIPVLLILFGLIGGAVLGFGFYLNHQLSTISRIVTAPPEASRPALAPAPDGPPQGQGPAVGPPINILLAGADNGDDGSSIAQAIRAGTWRPGSHRSDTIMILHIPADRRRAYIVSLPRDTFLAIDGHGKTKLNAAFSFGGPQLMQQTVEQFSGIRMDHQVIIDWNGFRDLSTALGGVTVHVAADVYDPAHRVLWGAGDHTLMGEEALEYVRTRYGLAGGDFDRIKRQQNFMREMLRKLVSRGTLTNPVMLTEALGAITRNVIVDSEFSDAAMRELALAMREIRTDDVTFLTIPVAGTGDEPGSGSVVYADDSRCADLFDALRRDDLIVYLKNRPNATTLAPPDQVR